MDYFIRVHVQRGDDYNHTALDVHFAEGDVDATCLAAAALVENLQPMYAGDRVSVDVYLNGRRSEHLASTGIMGRDDPSIQSIAREIEAWSR